VATQVTLAQNGTITSITGYVKGPPPKLVRYALYTDVAGEPGTRIVQSATATDGGNSYSWITIPVPATAVTAGTYWLAATFEQSNQYYANNGTSGGKVRWKTYDAITNGFLSSWGSSTLTLNNQSANLYATITPSSGGGGGGSGWGNYTYNAVSMDQP
jgi:hypothetical protein